MIKSRTKTTIKGDEKIKKFLAAMKQMKQAYVTIGVHQDAGRYTAGKNPPDVVMVAIWNEYGTSRSPARSFVGATVDLNRDKIEALRNRLMNDILDGELTPYEALNALGFYIQELIKNRIIRGIPPPNAMSTQRKKALAGVISKNVRYKGATNINMKSSSGNLFQIKTERKTARVGIDTQLTKSKTLFMSGLLFRSITYKVYLK